MTRMLAILTDDYADWEFGLVAAAARGYSGIEVVTASPDGQPVISMGGLRVQPDLAINDIDLAAVDALVVIGGTAWEGDGALDISELLHAAHSNGRLIAAICGGTRALAASGLLDAIPHTSNDAAYLADVRGYFGAAHYVASPAAFRCGRIITAPGTAPVSFMRGIITALGKGGEALDYYAEMFGAEFDGRRRMAA